MEKLEGLWIRKGGILWRARWRDDEFIEEDVTESAISYLFDRCELEDGVTLRDIFLLLNTELEIFDALLGNWCEDLVTEGLTAKADRDKDIEFLEIYWRYYKEGTSFFGGNIFPSFHAIGYLHETDFYDEYGNLMCKAGERVEYGVSMTSPSELIDIPIRFASKVSIHDETQREEKPQFFDQGEFSLGQILYGIIWELSFWGGPSERNKMSQEVLDMRKEIDNEIA